jgi:hypothetical protein
MAYGILCASSGVSGIIMPFANEVMLKKYGYPTTLSNCCGVSCLDGSVNTPFEGPLATNRTQYFTKVRLDMPEEAALLGLLYIKSGTGTRLLFPVTIFAILRNGYWT